MTEHCCEQFEMVYGKKAIRIEDGIYVMDIAVDISDEYPEYISTWLAYCPFCGKKLQ